MKNIKYLLIAFVLIAFLMTGCEKAPNPVTMNSSDEDATIVLQKKGKGGDIRVPADYATIQQAVDAANSGDVVAVSAGTYVEQVSITGKDIQIVGAEGAIIEAPTTMNISVTIGSGIYYAIVYVKNANVAVRGFKVDGKGLGNSHYRFVGLLYYHAGGRIDDCEVVDVRNTPFSGAQHGLAIYAYNDADAMQNIFITKVSHR